jgi:putative NADPH-quinone reductase
MSKNILLILGHPNKQSFCAALAESYKQGALSSGATVTELFVADLQFDLSLWRGGERITQLEPDVVRAQKLILQADHLVFVYPTWWGTMPAILKGFIDRVFIAGFAFKYREKSILWDKLLKGRTARVIVTMDAPPWYYRLMTGSPGHRAMKRATLKFCGIRPVRISSFGSVKKSTPEKRQQWLEKARRCGAQLN